jgi:uncharacterized protein (TIGR02996 family)
MQRYELGEEGSAEKFWEIWLDGLTVFMRFGKIDSDGQKKIKKVSNADAGKKEIDRFVAEKIKQGYKLVGEIKVAKKTKSDPNLEKAIIAAPDSPDAYAVYGDWLSEQEDPLGELIAIDVALAKKPKDATLQKKRKKLLDDNKASWIGELDELKGEGTLEWYCGFLKSVKMGYEEYGETEGLKAWTTLRKLPTSKFIQHLEFWIFEDDDGEPSYEPIIKSMVSLGVPKTLRSLAFDVKGYQISWTYLGDFSKLYPQLEKLETLRLAVGHMKLGTAIKLPSLKSFVVETGGFTKDNLKAVLAATWPNLETLSLCFGDDEYGCNIKMKDLKPLLDGKSLKKVKHLGLRNAQFQDEICEEIVRAPILKQLKTLDLSKGILTERGAKALVENAKALGHLEKLDVSEGFIPEEWVKKLKKEFGKKLDVSDQEKSDDDYRYVRIAE